MKYQGQTIEAGAAVPKGSTIDLVVMDGGSTTFDAPDYLGLNLEDAKVIIFGSNLNIGEITLVGDTLGVGPVILKQKPAPYENIKVGDVVDLWIGKEGTPVPDEDEDDEPDDNL
jgi:beta-lactam-binding protein with PASTA domain